MENLNILPWKPRNIFLLLCIISPYKNYFRSWMNVKSLKLKTGTLHHKIFMNDILYFNIKDFLSTEISDSHCNMANLKIAVWVPFNNKATITRWRLKLALHKKQLRELTSLFRLHLKNQFAHQVIVVLKSLHYCMVTRHHRAWWTTAIWCYLLKIASKYLVLPKQQHFLSEVFCRWSTCCAMAYH